MNKLDRRDRRRAEAVLRDARKACGTSTMLWSEVRPFIQAALKRERQETGTAVMWNFLFSSKADRAKTRRLLKKGAMVSA